MGNPSRLSVSSTDRLSMRRLSPLIGCCEKHVGRYEICISNEAAESSLRPRPSRLLQKKERTRGRGRARLLFQKQYGAIAAKVG